ncbi:MAG TPA: UbiA family prenyltransferase [Flavipsychrobacter sp.]|nr:UbiA family prenyltransferase [Flavipsychrobacter sp.]
MVQNFQLLLQKSTIQHLRFKFSFLLLPVYLFALSLSDNINWLDALIILLLIHLLLYPASNGYNSYMDKDEGSIGGIENPLETSRELYVVSVWMDIAGAALAFIISPLFSALYIIYIVFSRLYSYRGVRLKQYPIIGYLTVVVNQGALIFFMVYYGVTRQYDVPWIGLIVSTLLIGAFYPITQIYQHEQDSKDGVITISYKLGVRGTFVYCGCLYTIAFGLLAWYFYTSGNFNYFLVLQAWFLPVIGRFLWWAWQCWKDKDAANYKNTMRMNWLAATCTNLAFISLIIIKELWLK